jgi:hypothetical protein
MPDEAIHLAELNPGLVAVARIEQAQLYAVGNFREKGEIST